MSDPDEWFGEEPPATVEGDRDEHDDAWLDEPADCELGLRHSRAMLDRLSAGDPIGAPSLEAGECDDCAAEAYQRWELGQLALCRRCRRSREHARHLLDLAAPLESERPPLPPPPAVDEPDAR